MQRRAKQGVILTFYTLIFLGFLTALFFGFVYTAPTCTDGKQNQNETGIDCGGVCSQYCIADLASAPLSFEEVVLVPYTENSSDAVARIVNPNGRAALKSANYTFTVYNGSGEVTATQKGELSLLPKEEKTILALGLSALEGSKIELTITNEEWIAFTDYDSAPNIIINRQQFRLLSGEAAYAEATGLVSNKSPYDMRALTVNVVLRDAMGKVISVNKTTMNTLQSGEERDFRLIWPRAFSGEVAKTEMTYDFNSFAQQAFVKQYFPGGKYQTLDPGN
jgi:hypothetical protein